MPEDGTTSDNPNALQSLTELQYDRLYRWQKGEFTPGNKYIPPTSFDKIPIQDQPHALTKAALEWCIGGPLYPGIEVSWMAELPDWYDFETLNAKYKPLWPPFRINAGKIKPGDLTENLSMPWQSDFYSCNTHW